VGGVEETWLVPMQKQPMATSLVAASSTFSVIWVRERRPTKCTSRMRSINSSSDRDVFRYSTLV
jgi:hypothetical protein